MTFSPDTVPAGQPRIEMTLGGGTLGAPFYVSLSPGPPASTLPASLCDSMGPAQEPDHANDLKHIGRYQIEEVLGRGGMGMVLRARDEILQREVAVKVILPHYMKSDPSAGLRFLREAEIVARLSHPNIISVLDAGLDAGTAYLAFNYIRGTSFADLRSERRLNQTEAVDLMLPVVSAVAYAHDLGVIHGDLKPTNLLLGIDYAGRAHPWVLDFGVSFFRDLDPSLDPTRGRVGGTLGYLAPEWMNGAPTDERGDCFSLGCVLYEMLLGKGPLAHCHRLSESASAARSRDYPRPSEVSETDPLLSESVLTALAPDPKERFGSLREFGRSLLPFSSRNVRSRYGGDFTDPDDRMTRHPSSER